MVVTVMVAGLFAFAPIEQVSTVHTSDSFKDSVAGASPLQVFAQFDGSLGAVILDVTDTPGTMETVHIAAVLLIDESIEDDNQLIPKPTI